MSKKHRKRPDEGPKTLIILGLLALGVVFIIFINEQTAREDAARVICFQAQKAIGEAAERVRKAAPGELEKAQPKDVPALLAAKGGLASMPPHPGTTPSAPSPFVFGHGGIVYCLVHGAADGKQQAP